MERIQSQKRTKADFANQILKWVIFARRPMTIEELRCALVVKSGNSDLDEEFLPSQGSLLSVCGGLIMINGADETIRFIHYTIQEYFERTHHPQFSAAHTYLATVCITYLSFPKFASEPCSELPESAEEERVHRLRMRLKENTLLGYASAHWGDHVRENGNDDPTNHAMVKGFLARKANVFFSIETMHLERLSNRLFYLDLPKNLSDLHIGAEFGVEWLVEDLLQQGAIVDARDSHGLTALHRAAARGYTSVIKSLLEQGANPKSRCRLGYTPMEHAVSAGQEHTTLFLLKRGASLHDVKYVIHDVVAKGHLGVLRSILESSKDTREKATYVGTALKKASYSGNEACVRLLLERGTDLEISVIQSDLDEAAMQALERSHFVIVRLLLEHGAYFRKSAEALQRFIRSSETEAAAYLLDHGANIEAVNSEGDRPIHTSLRQLLAGDGSRKSDILKLLLERGADVNSYGSGGKTPLMIVAGQGSAKLVQQLLGHGADSLAKDAILSRSVIEWAIIEGHPRVVQLLLKSQRPTEANKGLRALARLYQALKHDVSDQYPWSGIHETHSEFGNCEDDPDDSESNDPGYYSRLLSEIRTLQREDLRRLLLLHYPARLGDEILVREFISMGADVEARLSDGDTALHGAARYGQTNIVRLLIHSGASIDPQTSSWRKTPLHYATEHVQYDTLQLLIEKGADIERGCAEGTPLMQATKHRNETIVRLLLEKGADPNAQTAWYPEGNILHNAVFYQGKRYSSSMNDSEIKIIRLLVAKGANLEARARAILGQTPLSFATT